MSPVKPVNLLPDMPVIQNSRRLTDKEQKDCDVIGRFTCHIARKLQKNINFKFANV